MVGVPVKVTPVAPLGASAFKSVVVLLAGVIVTAACATPGLVRTRHPVTVA